MRRFLAAVALLVGLVGAAVAQPTGTNTSGSSSITAGSTPTTCSTTQVLFALAGKVSCDSGFTYAGSSGQVTVGGAMFVTGNLSITPGQFYLFSGQGGLAGPADGTIQILNNAGSNRINIAVSGGNPGLATFNGQISVPVTTDSGQTATATVCEDITTHQFYFGSGTGGICKGTSSARFKDAIRPLTAGLDEVLNLAAISYYFKPEAGDPSRKLYGFTAEQMYGVIPDLVWLDKQDRPSSVDYVGLVPVLVRAIQQQQAEIDELKRRLN